MSLYSGIHRMCALTVYILAIVLFSSCAKLEGELLYQADTLDLFEAFFRYKFENNHSGAQKNADAYFLQIENKDPSPKFLGRFKKHSPPVRKGSEFVMGKGLLFRIDSYKKVGSNSVEIRGGYEEGNLSASWATYTWERKNAKWVLKSVGPVIVA